MTFTHEPAPDGSRPANAVDAAPAPQHTPLWRTLAAVLARIERFSRRRGSINVRAPIVIVMALLTIVAAGMAMAPAQTYTDWRQVRTGATALMQPLQADSTLDAHIALTVDDKQRLNGEVTETISLSAAEAGTFSRVLTTAYGMADYTPTDISATLDAVAVSTQPRTDGDYMVLDVDVPAGASTLVVSYRLHDIAVERAGRTLFDANVLGAAWPTTTERLHLTLTVPRTIADAAPAAPDLVIEQREWMPTDLAIERGDELTTYSRDIDMARTPAITHLTFELPSELVRVSHRAPAAWFAVLAPLVPLVVLAALALFAIAARRIAWGDAAGRGWIIAQSSPPTGVSAHAVARLWHRPRLLALVDTWHHRVTLPNPTAADRQRLDRRAKQEAHCAPPPQRAENAMARREINRLGLTRSRSGLVLDLFISTTLLMAVVQFAIVRQLVLRSAFVAEWWVGAVCVATIAAVVIMIVLLSGRPPLSPAGALVRDHAEGVKLYIEQTQLDRRITADDALLPYVAMFQAPERVRALADSFAPDVKVTNPCRARRASVALAAVASVVALATIVLGSLGPRVLDESADRTIDTWPQAAGLSTFAAVAHLQATASGTTLTVVETMTVALGDTSDRDPELAFEYPAGEGDHLFGTQLLDVTVDGRPARFELERGESIVVVRVLFDDDDDGATLQITTERTSPLRPVAPTSGPPAALEHRLFWQPTLFAAGADYTRELPEGARVDVSGVTLRVDAALVPALTSTINAKSVATGDLVLSAAPGSEAPAVIATFNDSLTTPADRAQAWRSWVSTTLVLGVLWAMLALAALATLVRFATVRAPVFERACRRVALILAAVAMVLACALVIVGLARGRPDMAGISLLAVPAGIALLVLSAIATALARRTRGSDPHQHD